MKLNLGRRIVLFIHWLASLALLAIIVFPDYADEAISAVSGTFPAGYWEYALIVLLAIYLLLSLSVLCMIFKRSKTKRSERGFITVDSADTGKVRIAVSAIEQMVKQAANTVDGVADMKISIDNSDDAIAIQVNVAMVSGSHVPTVTLNMQRAIRQYVEMNCGVAVRSVSVSIQSVAAADGGKRSKRGEAKAAAQAPIMPVQPAYVPETVQPEPVVPAEPEYCTVEDEPVAVEPVIEVAEPVDPEEPIAAVDELTCEEEKEN